MTTRTSTARAAFIAAFALPGTLSFAAGTWVTLPTAPHPSGGGFALLSDGTVMCKSQYESPAGTNNVGNVYDKLVPSSSGFYRTGSWTTSAAPMTYTRLYYSTQVLKDGRVYVAGGEYGTGKTYGEVYDPVANTWANLGTPGTCSDANSEILGDGRVLQAIVSGTLKTTMLFNPATNTYSAGPSCVGIHNESVWLKQVDGSILMVDRGATTSERYRPATNTWVADAAVPVSLYDPYGLETGGAVLLPDGRSFFGGSLGATAFYTPGVAGANGSWSAGPTMPNGTGTPDAPMAPLANGKVLMAVSPAPTSANHFPTPTTFWEFDPSTNAFTQVGAPGGGTSSSSAAYTFNFICLPDGSVLCSRQGSTSYWAYVPDGSPLAAAKPAVTGLTRSNGIVTLSGTQFNGNNEGASYGDDWQMNTNFPIVRLTNATGQVFTAKTFNWSSTGVQTGATTVTTQMTVPATLPAGSYSLYVTANGVASDAWPFWNPSASCPADLNLDGKVDGADLAIVLVGWGTPGSTSGAGDVSGDGTISGDDLGIVLNAWGSCP